MPKELWHLMLKVEYVEYLLKAIFKKKNRIQPRGMLRGTE